MQVNNRFVFLRIEDSERAVTIARMLLIEVARPRPPIPLFMTSTKKRSSARFDMIITARLVLRTSSRPFICRKEMNSAYSIIPITPNDTLCIYAVSIVWQFPLAPSVDAI